MKSKIILIFAVALAFYLASCSSDDNSTNPTPTGDYYKLNTNNYWVYETTDIDPDTNEKDVYKDSTVIVSQEVKEGKNAYKLKTYSNGDDSEVYQYSENGVLYTLLNDFLPDDGLVPIPDDQFDNKWIKIADPNASKWELISLNLTDIPLDFEGAQLNLSGTLKLEGTRGDKVIINVLGKDYTAQKYTINSIIQASTSFGDLPITIKATIPTHFYYADGIGLVKTETESTDISLLTFNFKTPSSVSVLINYKLN